MRVKGNPIYRREVTVRSRSLKLPLIICGFNGILAAVALLNMYSVVAQVKLSANIQYSSFLQLYVFVSTIEFLLLMFIMPALTSGGVSGERERQTLELLFTTRMSSWDIISGKVSAALGQLFMMVISSLPVLLLTFVYGGVDLWDLALLLFCYMTVALFAGGLGILFSSKLKRSTFANVWTYGALLLIVAGTLMVNVFAFRMREMELSGMAAQMGGRVERADSGRAVYLLLVNPVTTFATILDGQVGSVSEWLTVRKFLGAQPDNFITAHWVPISLSVQLALAAVFIFAAVRFLKPGGGRGPKAREPATEREAEAIEWRKREGRVSACCGSDVISRPPRAIWRWEKMR